MYNRTSFRRVVGLAAVGLLSIGPLAAFQSQPVVQHQLAVALLEGPTERRQWALAKIVDIPMADRAEEVQAALRHEVRRTRTVMVNGGRAHPLAGSEFDYPEEGWIFEVLDPVVAAHDPRAIATMLLFLESGTAITKPLSTFGELAVWPLIEIATDTLQADGWVQGAIETFSIMLQSQPEFPLSERAKSEIHEIAIARLAPGRRIDPAVLLAEADLTLAFQDTVLRRRLDELATDSLALRAALGWQADTTIAKYALAFRVSRKLLRDKLAKQPLPPR